MTFNKRSTIILYSGDGVPSHKVRIVLAEKGVCADILDNKTAELNADLRKINPYNSLPTLIDRDLVLYEPCIITDFLDERFPHPPLLPAYPTSRAKMRLTIHRIDQDWHTLLSQIEHADKEDAALARQELQKSLIGLAPVFTNFAYFLQDEFSLLDCTLAPLLWRLPKVGITLDSPQAKPILDYAKRIFKRATFQTSLSEVEREFPNYDF